MAIFTYREPLDIRIRRKIKIESENDKKRYRVKEKESEYERKNIEKIVIYIVFFFIQNDL